ncbi:DUF1534 domain-containing protein [Pseudomonas syringae pv. actinidiae]|nr:DUF1534 domain-containing protein [Pseudomonas syringae pv. actinidiae]
MRLSFLTHQRRNACRDAPRHKSAQHRVFKIGRRASRTACRRAASHDSWDYRSLRSSVGMPVVTLHVTNLRSTAVLKTGRGSEQELRLFTCRRRYESLRQ